MSPAPDIARRAIVLLDHGSRRREANEQLEELARRVRRRCADSIVRTAHLEIEPPDLAEAIAACVEDGATEIVIHPHFLGPGRHTIEDIPLLVEAARRRHPTIPIRTTAPVGVDEKLVDLVLKRIDDAL